MGFTFLFQLSMNIFVLSKNVLLGLNGFGFLLQFQSILLLHGSWMAFLNRLPNMMRLASWGVQRSPVLLNRLGKSFLAGVVLPD